MSLNDMTNACLVDKMNRGLLAPAAKRTRSPCSRRLLAGPSGAKRSRAQGSRLQRRHTKAQVAFQKRAEQLCKALSAARPAQRQLAVSTMSEGLRRALIRVREAQRRREELSRPKAEEKSSPQATPRFMTSAPASRKKSPQGSSSPSKLVPKGNLWTISSKGEQHYKVRLSIGRVVMTSQRFQSISDAAALLSLLRDAASRCAAAGGDQEAMLRAVAHAATSAAEQSEQGQDLAFGLVFQAVFDARRALGRRLCSPSVTSVEEAICARRQVLEVEGRGVAAVRQAWLEWAQASRHCRGRQWRLQAAQAEKVLMQLPEPPASAVKKEKVAKPKLGRLARLIRIAERALEVATEALAEAAAKAAQESKGRAMRRELPTSKRRRCFTNAREWLRPGPAPAGLESS